MKGEMKLFWLCAPLLTRAGLTPLQSRIAAAANSYTKCTQLRDLESWFARHLVCPSGRRVFPAIAGICIYHHIVCVSCTTHHDSMNLSGLWGLKWTRTGRKWSLPKMCLLSGSSTWEKVVKSRSNTKTTKGRICKMKVEQKQIMILDHQDKFLISKGTYSGIKRVRINTVEPKQKNLYCV